MVYHVIFMEHGLVLWPRTVQTRVMILIVSNNNRDITNQLDRHLRSVQRSGYELY